MRGRGRWAGPGGVLPSPAPARVHPGVASTAGSEAALGTAHDLDFCGRKGCAPLPGERCCSLKNLGQVALPDSLGCRHRKIKRNWVCHNQDGRWSMMPVQCRGELYTIRCVPESKRLSLTSLPTSFHLPQKSFLPREDSMESGLGAQVLGCEKTPLNPCSSGNQTIF